MSFFPGGKVFPVFGNWCGWLRCASWESVPRQSIVNYFQSLHEKGIGLTSGIPVICIMFEQVGIAIIDVISLPTKGQYRDFSSDASSFSDFRALIETTSTQSFNFQRTWEQIHFSKALAWEYCSYSTRRPQSKRNQELQPFSSLALTLVASEGTFIQTRYGAK